MNELKLINIENRIVSFLEESEELKLKEFFLADLSWLKVDDSLKETMSNNGYANNKTQTIVDFFTKRFGKRIFHTLPRDIQEFIVNNSDE